MFTRLYESYSSYLQMKNEFRGGGYAFIERN